MTLPIPSITPAIIPDEAAGKMIRHKVCHRVAPSRMPLLCNVLGTLTRASSEILMIVGNAINASSKLP